MIDSSQNCQIDYTDVIIDVFAGSGNPLIPVGTDVPARHAAIRPHEEITRMLAALSFRAQRGISRSERPLRPK
jgi:hypothetical protein